MTGIIRKGYLNNFSPDGDSLTFEELETDTSCSISMASLKAIFFVRTFEGDPEYREHKSYGIRKPRGKRVFIKFRDGENMVGFLQGPVPWNRGFFLYRSQGSSPGFFIVPADEESNNIKIFVITGSVDDVTVVP